MRLYIAGEFREILDYDGTTKVATVDSTYTVTPVASDPYDIRIPFISPLIVQTVTGFGKRQYSGQQ